MGQSLAAASSTIWDAYKQSAGRGGMSPECLARVEVDSVGFALAEVCRTALGFAGGRLWLQFENADVKKQAVTAAMRIVGKCMIGRHQGGIKLLLGELDTLAASEGADGPSPAKAQ